MSLFASDSRPVLHSLKRHARVDVSRRYRIFERQAGILMSLPSSHPPHSSHPRRQTPATEASSQSGSTEIQQTPVVLTVNGRAHPLRVEPRRTLLDALREDLHLTGAKSGCNMGQCGACTVLVDGEAVYSCLLLAVECQGRAITTIEGLAHDDTLDPVQQAFIEHDALQCGFCTPGQILALKALLQRNAHPDDEEIERAMSGNICRCGAYPKIMAAARALAGRSS